MSLPAQDWRTAPELSRAHQVMAHQQARAAMGARLAERATSSGKQLETAYLLWALLGHLGGHHFYLHRLATGALYTVLSVVGWVSFYQGLGVTFLVPVWLGLGVDLLLIPTYRARARHSIWSVG
ncbi:MAG: hypothetical protein CSA58_04640 [Micrococcales bacterium]|nr:MAG: hypothetical protein CSA58_04640 [Micrococcales bacterium]